MTDLATLTVTVDTTSVAGAAGDLNALTGAAANLDTAARNIQTATSSMASAFANMAGQISSLQGAMASLNGAAAQTQTGFWDWVERLANLKDLVSITEDIDDLAKALPKTGAAAAEAAEGLLGLVRAGGPVGAAVAAIAAALITADAARRDYVEGQKDLDGAFEHLSYTTNTTVGDLQRLAESAGTSANISIASARDMEVAYINMGISNTDVMTKLIGTTVDYAQATGVDAKQATDELGAALAGSTTALESVDGKLNFLDDRTKQYLLKLRDQNDMTGYQSTLLGALSGHLAKTTTKIDGLAAAWANAKRKAADYWEKFGKGFQQFVAPDPEEKARHYGPMGGRNVVVEQAEQERARQRQQREEDQRRRVGKTANEYVRSLLPNDKEIREAESTLVRLKKLRGVQDVNQSDLERAVLETQGRLKRLKGEDLPTRPAIPSRTFTTRTNTNVKAALSGPGCDCGSAKDKGCAEITQTCTSAETALGKTADAAAKVNEAYEEVEPLTIFSGEVKKTIENVEGLVTTLPQVAVAAEGMVPPSLNDQLKTFGATAKEVGTLFTQVLGDAGKPFANAANGIATMTEAYAAHAAKIKEINASTASDETKRQQTQLSTIDTYAKMAGAAKGFFKEGSTGYKAMEAAEKAFRTVQLAMQIRAMAMQAKELAANLLGITATTTADTAATGVSTGNSLLRAGASVMAGAAKMFEQGGIVGFALVAAMLAVMASLGFGGGGGSSAKPFNLKDVQEKQGTGTVLGDPTAKSNSIEKSLEHAQKMQERGLGYSSAMVGYLRSIDTKIGSAASMIARQLGAGGSLSTKNLGLGETVNSKGFLSIGWLGGGKTTRELQDQGIQLQGGTVGSISDSGRLEGGTYQDVRQTRTSSFLWFKSVKESVETQIGTLDDDLSRQLGLIVRDLRGTLLSAAKTLGIEGAEATIDAFEVNLGRISFKDMKGDEIVETLNAVFSKLGDDIATTLFASLEDYQQVGEGAFETMVRLATGLQTVKVAVENAGMAFNYIGVAAINASQDMINAAGGLDAFVSGMEFFAQNFLTEAERMKIASDRVVAAMAAMGLASVTTAQQFKEAMQIAIAAGDEARVAALLAIQKDFVEVEKYEEKLAEAQAQVASSAASAASSLSQVNDGFGDLIKNLKKFRDELLKGPAANLSPEEQYKLAAADFDRVSKLAASGDQQAQSELQTVSQALLTASKAYFASSQGYNDDFQRVLAVLDKIVGARPETLSILDRPTPGDMRPVSLDRTGGIYTTQKVANDNEEIADLLRAVKDELRAANLQRGAVGEAQLKRLEKVCDQLDATKRELARA